MEAGFKDKRLAVIGKNRYEWALAYYAHVFGLGVVIPLDKGLPAEELAMSLTKAKADILVFDKDQLGLVEYLKEHSEFDSLQYICMDSIDGYESIPAMLEKGKAMPAEKIAEYKSLPIDGKAMSFIIFTSGTTSTSKAVMLSHKNICSDIMSTRMTVNVSPKDTALSFLRIHHTYECTLGFLTLIYSGGTIVFCDGLRHIVKNLQESHATIMVCVPLLFENMYQKIWHEIDKKGKRVASWTSGSR